MSKQDKIINAISKCLTRVKLNEEELDLVCNLKSVDFLEYDLSINDISLIKKWCKTSQRHLKENREAMNLDYGHNKSDSKEGQMAKRALLTMAKDMYNLYCTLNDGDDLPEWCHYKLANSRKDLSDITDYITSKIMKKCVDGQISQNDLRLEIKRSFHNNNTLTEGFLDFLKGKNVNKIFKELMSTSSQRRGFNTGFTRFMKDCSKLISEIESQGGSSSRTNKGDLDYDQYNSLFLIRKKLKASYNKLSKMSNKVVSAKNESFDFKNIKEAKSRNQKSRALEIKLKLANKEYSKIYYKQDTKPSSMRDIVDCISTDIKIISRIEKLNKSQKNQLVILYKDFVLSLYERINKIIENTINFEFDSKELDLANNFNKMRNDLGQSSILMDFLENANKAIRTFYNIKKVPKLINKVGKLYSIKGNQVNSDRVLLAVDKHIESIEKIKSALKDADLKEVNFSKYPDIAANYIGFIDKYVVASNRNDILKKIEIIYNQLNNKYFLDSEVRMISNKLAKSLKISGEETFIRKINKEVRKILIGYCDNILINLKKCKNNIISAHYFLKKVYKDRDRIPNNPIFQKEDEDQNVIQRGGITIGPKRRS